MGGDDPRDDDRKDSNPKDQALEHLKDEEKKKIKDGDEGKNFNANVLEMPPKSPLREISSIPI